MSLEQAVAMVEEEVRRLDSHRAGNIRVYGDMTECARCKQVWDTNDPSPPYCIRRREPPYKGHPTIAILIVTSVAVVGVIIIALVT